MYCADETGNGRADSRRPAAWDACESSSDDSRSSRGSDVLARHRSAVEADRLCTRNGWRRSTTWRRSSRSRRHRPRRLTGSARSQFSRFASEVRKRLLIMLCERLVPAMSIRVRDWRSDCLPACRSVDECHSSETPPRRVRPQTFERGRRKAMRQVDPLSGPGHNDARRVRRTRIRRLWAEGKPRNTSLSADDELCSKHVSLRSYDTLPSQSAAPKECFADATELGVGSDLELAAGQICTHLPRPSSRPKTRLSINVSGSCGFLTNFFELVTPVAEKTIIELTEHEPVEDLRGARRERCRNLGMEPSSDDDVGAGFANLPH